MKHTRNTGARFYGAEVQQKQDEIFIGNRKDIVKAVKLPPQIRGVDTFTYIHFVTRGMKDGTTGAEKKRDSGIPGLNIIYPMDKSVPKEVIDATRGTVIHDLRDVVLRPIETKPNINLNHLTVKDGNIVIPTQIGSSVYFPLSTVKIVTYVEGHFIRIWCPDKPRFATSTNLVPEGLYKEVNGKRSELRGPSRWGHGTAFMEDINNILRDTIPDLLTKLYPKGTQWSPWCYPCILVTQQRIRATQDYVGKPYLIMLDPQRQWDPKDPPKSIKSEVRKLQDKPFDLSSLGFPEEVPEDKRDLKSYILYKKKGIDVDEANAYLRGNPKIPTLGPKGTPGRYKLSGGGKIIITGPAIRGTTRNERLAFHVESDGWIWRETDANEPSIYTSFLQQLNDRNWLVGADDTTLDVIKQKYLPLVLPKDSELPELNQNMKLMKDPPIALMTAEEYARAINENFDRLVWYNRLVAANPIHRPMIMLFLKRYGMDLNAAVEWLINLDVANTTFDEDVKIALKKKRFITKLKNVIELTIPVPLGLYLKKDPTPMEAVKSKGSKTVIKKPAIGSKLETPQEKYFNDVKGLIEKRKQGVSTKLVSIYHDVKKNKFDSILITEPDAKRREDSENLPEIATPTPVKRGKIVKMEDNVPAVSTPVKRSKTVKVEESSTESSESPSTSSED